MSRKRDGVQPGHNAVYFVDRFISGVRATLSRSPATSLLVAFSICIFRKETVTAPH